MIVTEKMITIYIPVMVVCLIIGIASNSGYEHRIKGRYILLGSLFWPITLVVVISHILAAVIVEMLKVVKENFWDTF